MAGLKEYFERALPRILLYRYVQGGYATGYTGETRMLTRPSFERIQYHEVRESWPKAEEGQPRSVCDSYGVEHLCRMLGMSTRGLV